MGADCVVGPHVYLTGVTKIGAGNQFHAGCVIGDAPQDLKYKDAPTRVMIGDNNVFREHVTVNRATNSEAATVVGSNNFIMANAHIAHNCVVGNHVIMANGTLLGGHVDGAGSRVSFRQLSGAPILPRRHAGDHAGRLGHQQGSAAVHRGARASMAFAD